MAAAKKTKAGFSPSPKKTETKAPAKKVAKPVLKKASPKKAPPPKPASRVPARPVPKKGAPASKPKAAKPAAAKPQPAKKAAPAAAAPKTNLAKKAVGKAAPPPAKPAQKPVTKPAPAADPKKPRFLKGDRDHFKTELLSMRDRITGQSGAMRSAALQRNDETNHEEDGTDAFMRLQTLEQVSSQQQIVANIDESLRSIEKGTYGVCDNCGELINKARLAVLPFAKNCIKCQSEMERPNRFGGRR